MSFGVNGGTITASVSAAAGGGVQLTQFSQYAEFNTNAPLNNGILSVQKVSVAASISATKAAMVLAMSGNSGSSGAMTVSFGVYTLNGSTASLASSGSRAVTWTSGNDTVQTSNYVANSGTVYRTIPISMNLTPGDYLFAFHMHTTNDGTWKVFGRNAVMVSGLVDEFGSAYWNDGNLTNSFTTAMPASIALTEADYARTGSDVLRQPGVILVGSF